MTTAKEKAAQSAEEKEAAERAAREKAAADAATAQAAKDAEEKAAKDAAEKEVAEKAAQEAAALAAKSSGVMKVFCKLPSGMTFSVPDGEITLKGAADSALVGGYGVTFLPKSKWEALENRYGNMDMFTKKIIYAEKSLEDGLAVAKEMNGEKTGFEGIDPKNPGKDLEPGKK